MFKLDFFQIYFYSLFYLSFISSKAHIIKYNTNMIKVEIYPKKTDNIADIKPKNTTKKGAENCLIPSRYVVIKKRINVPKVPIKKFKKKSNTLHT